MSERHRALLERLRQLHMDCRGQGQVGELVGDYADRFKEIGEEAVAVLEELAAEPRPAPASKPAKKKATDPTT